MLPDHLQWPWGTVLPAECEHLLAVLQAVAAAACSTLRALVKDVPADPAWKGLLQSRAQNRATQAVRQQCLLVYTNTADIEPQVLANHLQCTW